MRGAWRLRRFAGFTLLEVMVAAFVMGIAVVGVLYAVILGFVVVIVWQQFDNAHSNAQSEAVTVENLFNNSVAFGPQGRPLERDLLVYVSRAINR